MEKSLKRYSLLLVVPFACLATVPAFAQGPTPSVTMEVLEEGEAAEELFKRIELPAEASDQARESSQRGLDTANAARAGGPRLWPGDG